MKKIFNLAVGLFVFVITFLAVSFVVLKNSPRPAQTATAINPTTQTETTIPVATPATPTQSKNNPSETSTQPEEPLSPLQNFPICQEVLKNAKDGINQQALRDIHNEINASLAENHSSAHLNTEETCATLLTGLKLLANKEDYPDRKINAQELKQEIRKIVKEYSLNETATEKIFTTFQIYYEKSMPINS